MHIALRPTLLFVLLQVLVVIEHSSAKETLTPSLDICRLFVDGTKLRKPGYCDRGIVCQNGKSVDGLQCPGTYYVRDTAKCATKSSDSYCKTACAKGANPYVVDKKNCKGWYNCNGATELAKGYCPDGMYYQANKNMCLYPSQSDCVAYYEFCDVAPPEVNFADEVNCHKYYQCTKKGILDPKTCPTGTYYVTELGRCIAKAQVDCYKHPYPENVCGTVKIPIEQRFVSDQATCGGYFYCKAAVNNKPDATPTWSQCKDGQFFNEALQACTAREHTKCTEDRCEGRESDTEIAQVPGCQHYLQCQNNYTVSLEPEFCGYDKWYDEEKRACVDYSQKPIRYGACV